MRVEVEVEMEVKSKMKMKMKLKLTISKHDGSRLLPRSSLVRLDQAHVPSPT
jgi:hypothetical protein